MKIYFKVFILELVQHYRNLGSCFNIIFFYLMLIVLFPLSITSNGYYLSNIGVGIIWVSFLLSMLLTGESIFIKNIHNGLLEQLIISRISIPCVIIIQVFVQWVAVIFPLIMLTPIAIILLHVPLYTGLVLIFSLLISTPSILMIISLASSLTICLKNRSILLIILVIPLIIPIIITSIGSVYLFTIGISNSAQIALLLATFIFSLLFIPIIISLILTESMR